MNKKIKSLIIKTAVISASISGLSLHFYNNQKKVEKLNNQILEEINTYKNIKNELLKAEQSIQIKKQIEKKKQKYGVGPNGEAFSYNSQIIWTKLKNHDYSNNGEKIAFLTFDDGPSTTVTPKILDILKEMDVKATFFVLGNQLESDNGAQLLKRIYEEGHAIGNHTYSHNYRRLYPGRNLNLSEFVNEINSTEKKAKEILGPYFNINVVRCPGGYMSWNGMSSLETYLKDNNKSSIDWNALNGDAEGKKRNPQELLNRFKQSFGNHDIEVILMHDTYGKENTAKMLKELILFLKSKGYSFKSLV